MNINTHFQMGERSPQMKSKVIKEVRPLMETEFGLGVAHSASGIAEMRFRELCRANSQDPKPVRKQTVFNLYPCIGLYEGLQQAGVKPQTALQFLDRVWSLRAVKKARSIQKMLKIPGLYKLMPRIFKKVTLGQFGEAAGFYANFYDLGSSRCKFDMIRCLYCDLCQKYGCPELGPCFCHTDDVTSGHMHDKLLWNRTKTMGEGGDVCDFDLLIQEK